MHTLAWALWWLNTAACLCSIIYWAPKRFPNGLWALLMPSGQFWIWQLFFGFIVLLTGLSPFCLLWLAVVSAALSLVVGNVLYKRQLERRFAERSASVNPSFHIDGSVTSNPSVLAACSLLAGDEQHSFKCFLSEFQTLAQRFKEQWVQDYGLTVPQSRWEISQWLNKLALDLCRDGHFHDATSALACSRLFVENNPLNWAAEAEVYWFWEDLIAARYAERVLTIRLPAARSAEFPQELFTTEGRQILKEARSWMKEIASSCKDHPEWRDSYELKRAAGIIDF